MIMQSWLNTLVSRVRNAGVQSRRRHRRSYQQQVLQKHEMAVGSEDLEERVLLTGIGSDHFITNFFGQNVTWADAIPATPEIDIYYDYRNEIVNGSFYQNAMADNAPNSGLQADYRAATQDALNAWATASQGALNFIRNTTLPLGDVWNLGVGDLSIVSGGVSGSGGTLGVAQLFDSNGNVIAASASTTIASARSWLDEDETWDTTKGNGDISGTIDFFTIAAHEIGHTLGLDHVFPYYDAVNAYSPVSGILFPMTMGNYTFE